MKKLTLLLLAMLAVPLSAQAEDPRKEALNGIHRGMFQQHELCVVYGRAVLSQEKSDAEQKLAACTAEGKSDVRKTGSDLAGLIKGKAAQEALKNWRLAWTDAYDAADIRSSETYEAYLRRVTETLRRTETASSNFTATVLKSPLY